MNSVSVFRLNLLRVFYAVLFFGLGTFIWPEVIHHTNSFGITYGIRFSLLAALGAMAGLGLRYPLQMLPILLFELLWKAIYLLGFALPLYLAHGIDSATAEDIRSVLMVVVFIPCVPWRYVFANYVAKPGERWRGGGRGTLRAEFQRRGRLSVLHPTHRERQRRDGWGTRAYKVVLPATENRDVGSP